VLILEEVGGGLYTAPCEEESSTDGCMSFLIVLKID
jgi:hypothetical protein